MVEAIGKSKYKVQIKFFDSITQLNEFLDTIDFNDFIDIKIETYGTEFGNSTYYLAVFRVYK
jgi:hypothetical protein